MTLTLLISVYCQVSAEIVSQFRFVLFSHDSTDALMCVFCKLLHILFGVERKCYVPLFPCFSPPSVISLEWEKPSCVSPLYSSCPAQSDVQENLSCFSSFFYCNTLTREYTTRSPNGWVFHPGNSLILLTPAGCPTVQFSSDIAYPELAAEHAG